MSEEKRHFIRTEFPASALLTHQDIDDVILKVRDVSEGGIYLETGVNTILPVGSLVKIQVVNDEVETPVVDMEIVRVDSEGMGLMFITGVD